MRNLTKKWHYKKFLFEFGRYQVAWRGWKRATTFNIGRTKVYSVGPFAVFKREKKR